MSQNSRNMRKKTTTTTAITSNNEIELLRSEVKELKTQIKQLKIQLIGKDQENQKLLQCNAGLFNAVKNMRMELKKQKLQNIPQHATPKCTNVDTKDCEEISCAID
ncbi:9631_t:CDS:1 [Ambispora leptoticha]|uniref:9631_t:CDS:1 n=1 Tax=Ambispora leptoticha TaxID=144679 RepID=A0A9N9AD19_9GLOM|nr:9631_t:CDS:1 [Ambispora leptoticha]